MLNIDLKETADTLRTKAKEVNKDFLKVSNEVVEETIAAGEQWQDVFADAMKTGTTMFGQQQKLALKAVAGVREQYIGGSKRLMNLFGIDAKEVSKKIKETATEAKAKVAKVTTTAKNKANKTIKATTEEAKGITKTVEKKTMTAKKAVSKATTKVEKKASKAIDKTVAAIAPTVKRDNLKLINGVGPKMEEVLNKFGIETFDQLAKSDAKNLAAMLETENARYATFNVAEWVEAANKMTK